MLFLSRTIYALAITLYGFIIHLASFFNPKAKAWVKGRKHIEQDLKSLDKNKQTIWMHAASLGEFEQGWPLIEELKTQLPEAQVLVTFYSPSGYEVIQPKGVAEVVTYMPLDTAANAKQFINAAKPTVALFVKYEFWYFHLSELKDKGIPTFLVSAHFLPNSIFFSWYGGLHRKMLGFFQKLFVQSESSKTLLTSIGHGETTLVTGDTRLDRVLNISTVEFNDLSIAAFCAGHKVIVAGSTWPADEKIIAATLGSEKLKEWKLIIAPHEVNDARIKDAQSTFGTSAILHSSIPLNTEKKQVLIIDSLGILSKLYRYADVAYIGGGLGSGIHNILEPIAYNVPVLFGPKHIRFQEATDLLSRGAAKVVNSSKEIESAIQYFSDGENKQNIHSSIQNYINSNKGASQKMAEVILKTMA